MASTEISIKQLPTITSIESGNFVIVQTENATTKLDFKDFVVGLENTTFANVISSSTAGFAGITANTTRSINNASNIAANAANITSLNTDMDTVSADVISLSSSVGGLNIDGTGGVTFTALTATSLSAGSLSANGNEFRGYPSYNQVIYKGFTTRQGGGDLSLDLATSINLKYSNSKVRVSFSVPGVNNTNVVNFAFVVQESDDGITYADVPELLAGANGTASRGTVVGGSDAGEEVVTTSFTGLFTPAGLDGDNEIRVRIVLKLDPAYLFYQNYNGTNPATLYYNAVGISTLLIEEVFV